METNDQVVPHPCLDCSKWVESSDIRCPDCTTNHQLEHSKAVTEVKRLHDKLVAELGSQQPSEEAIAKELKALQAANADYLAGQLDGIKQTADACNERVQEVLSEVEARKQRGEIATVMDSVRLNECEAADFGEDPSVMTRAKVEAVADWLESLGFLEPTNSLLKICRGKFPEDGDAS